MTLLYVDSSALTKLVVAETGSPELRELVTDARLVTSRVAEVEVAKAVTRVDPHVDLGPLFERLSFIELDAGVTAAARDLGGPELRSLDAIHIASAITLGDELSGFVTYDMRQAIAARAEGLHVVSSGIERA